MQILTKITRKQKKIQDKRKEKGEKRRYDALYRWWAISQRLGLWSSFNYVTICRAILNRTSVEQDSASDEMVDESDISGFEKLFESTISRSYNQ